ncbi:ABC transporter ATP-binding protein [Anaplasmataceae bacterium AB001_6]|nr:ABC transporter ATP-binding protein [Anaplasmataceae bacterium AB001_6]
MNRTTMTNLHSGLELSDIGFHYSHRDFFKIQDINLNIPKGAIVSIIGHSGCGKSTLLRLIAGFHKPKNGSIAIEGNVVSDTNSVDLATSKRNIGIVFQTPSLFPHKNVLENISFAIRNQPKEMILMQSIEALNLVGMQQYSCYYPSKLSGGQQQLITLARAMVNSPSLLMMDEPFSNIDAIKKQEILAKTIKIIRNRKTTTIIVTHDPMEALDFSDFICFMDNGKIIQYDTPRNIYHCPVNSTVASFFGKLNKIDVRIKNGCVMSEWGKIEVADKFLKCINKNKYIYIRPDAFIENQNNGRMCKIKHVNYFTNNAMIEYCDNLYWVKLKNALNKKDNDMINLDIDQDQVLVF